MNKIFLIIIVLFVSFPLHADGLEGLRFLPLMITVYPIGVINLLVLLVSSIPTITKATKVQKSVYISGGLLILNSIAAIVYGAIVEGFDLSYYIMWGVLIMVPYFLMFLSFRMVDKRINKVVDKECKGKWLGCYWFVGDVAEKFKDRKTKFELIIDTSVRSKIRGHVSDDVETGGMKGVGRIIGRVKGNRINFIKLMPVMTITFKDGERIETDKPHKPIYYKGVINGTMIEGTWKIKSRFGIVNGRIFFSHQCIGKWTMKRE